MVNKTFKYVAPKTAQKCADEIIDWALKHGLWYDCGLYVNGKIYRSHKEYGDVLYKEYTDPVLEETYRVWQGERDPWTNFEYVNPNHFISMYFEGPLNHVLNFLDDFAGDYDSEREEELCKIFEKYGYYYELGNSWNLSAYKNE